MQLPKRLLTQKPAHGHVLALALAKLLENRGTRNEKIALRR